MELSENFVDSEEEAVFTGPGQIIRFFQDDITTGQAQAGHGWVDLIRIYDRPLTNEEIEILNAPPPIPLPAFDQRGPGFVRAADVDGMNGPSLDMGAYEAQQVPTFATGDYNQNGSSTPLTTSSGAKRSTRTFHLEPALMATATE